MSHSAPLPTPARRSSEVGALLRFGAGSRHPYGFGYLGDDGAVIASRPLELYITARMTHCFALAGIAPSGLIGGASDEESERYRNLAAHGVAALSTHFWDDAHGGYFSAIDPATGEPALDGGDRKEAYAHAFVTLAAATASVAGVVGAPELLDDALKVSTERFWDENAGMVYESYTRDFTLRESYRGANAAMHTVESYLAAAAATGKDEYLDRASRMLERVVGTLAPAHEWRIPEHLGEDYSPLPDFNRDRPADPFRPFGATPGHWFEWSRLALHTARELELRGRGAPTWMTTNALELIDAAQREAWHVDGADGYLYTVDLAGRPVVHQRMHWVACEAFAAGIAAAESVGDGERRRWLEIAGTAWRYCEHFLIEKPGQWRHELDAHNRPDDRTWDGKPDIYHAMQALLMPDVALAPALASALADGDRVNRR